MNKDKYTYIILELIDSNEKVCKNILYKTSSLNDAIKKFQDRLNITLEELQKNICNQSNCLAVKLCKYKEYQNEFLFDKIVLEYKTTLYQRMLKDIFNINTLYSYKDLSNTWEEIDRDKFWAYNI